RGGVPGAPRPRPAAPGGSPPPPPVLVRNPAMWHRLDADSRSSIRRGTLLRGTTVLRQLAQRIDREAAHTVFRVSGLR
ncbi:hypothetical protein ACFXA3_35845, partial [Streptomyces sp. NPDC059456]